MKFNVILYHSIKISPWKFFPKSRVTAWTKWATLASQNTKSFLKMAGGNNRGERDPWKKNAHLQSLPQSCESMLSCVFLGPSFSLEFSFEPTEELQPINCGRIEDTTVCGFQFPDIYSFKKDKIRKKPIRLNVKWRKGMWNEGRFRIPIKHITS